MILKMWQPRMRQWRILGAALITVVLVPTLALVWLMLYAVRNEQFAFHQQMETLYRQRVVDVSRNLNWETGAWIDADMDIQDLDTDKYYQFITSRNDGILLIFDNRGDLVFPQVDSAEAFGRARGNLLESVESVDDAGLADEWGGWHKLEDLGLELQEIRALKSSGKLEEARQQARAQSFRIQGLAGTRLSSLELGRYLVYNYLLQIELYDPGEREYLDVFSKLMEIALDREMNGLVFTGPLRLFAGRKLLEHLEAMPAIPPGLPRNALRELSMVCRAKMLGLWMKEMQIGVPELYQQSEGAWVYSMLGTDPYYLKVYGVNDFYYVRLLPREEMQQNLKFYLANLTDDFLSMQVLDRQNRPLFAVQEKNQEMFSEYPMDGHFGGWKISLRMADASFFEDVAQKKGYVYVWITLLVIAVIIVATFFVLRAALFQIRTHRLKNDLIATVSHELKTPLASMRILLDTLIDGRYRDKKQVAEYLDLISTENLRLSRLIESFLTFNRLERHKQSFRMHPCQPAMVAEMAGQAMEPRFSASNVEFHMDCVEPIGDMMGDMDALVTVLVNLLDNALKYTGDEKEISLLVCESPDGRICYEVKDNGVGISMFDRKRIFDRFHQLDTNLSRNAEGVGLGLSIVKYIVEAHQGEIQIESKSGQGSVFRVLFPAL